MKFYLPNRTPTTQPYVSLDPDGEYTSNPTAVRVYREDHGDEYPWCIDAVDSDGRYIDDVRRFGTEQECMDVFDDLVSEWFK